MMYSLSHTALSARPGPFGLPSLSPALPAGNDWGLLSRDRFDASNDALLRRLLANDDQVSDDMLGRYLDSIRGERGLPFDASIAVLFARLRERPLAGTILMPDTRLVLPPPIGRRDDRPIVLRGGAPITAPRAPRIEATKSVALPIASIDEGDATDLSSALAACVTDDRIRARGPTRRRRLFANKSIWAAAAALASIAIVTPIAMRWSSSAAPVRAAIEIPSPTKRAAPSPVTSATAAIPAMMHVAIATPPPEPAPLPPRPTIVATVEPVRAPAIAERDTTAVAAVSHAAPLAVSPAPVAATPVMVPLVAMRPTPVVARAAKRKPRRTMAAKGTIVASALALPDVLKPH